MPVVTELMKRHNIKDSGFKTYGTGVLGLKTA